jgi:hypothetical protein
MTIEKAVKLLKKYHKQAEDNNKVYPNFIKNPVAWALYQVWREANTEGK